MHWPEANVLIAAGHVDPAALVPDYNVTVSVELLTAGQPSPGAQPLTAAAAPRESPAPRRW